MTEPIFDSSAHRSNRNYPKRILAARVVWTLLSPLFRCSPRHLYGWRNFLLRRLGARIGRAVRIYPSADIFYPWNVIIEDDATIGPRVQVYSLGKISIGRGALISQNVHLCAGSHDYTQAHLPLLTPPISIGAGAWLCADAFVGPGVTVGEFAIVGARAVAVRDVPPRAIVAGNPARVLRERPAANTHRPD